MAVANYESAHGHYPPAWVPGPGGARWHSWRVLILPDIEHDDLFKEYRFDEPWDGPNNRRLAARMPKIYAFHNARRPGQTTTNYLAVVGPTTMWPGKDGRKAAEVVDGRSNTALIAENTGLGVHWMEPRDLDLDAMSLDSNHPHGVSSWSKAPAVVTADGSVARLAPGLRPDVLRALLTATGKEPPASGAGGWDLIPDGRLREPGPPAEARP